MGVLSDYLKEEYSSEGYLRQAYFYLQWDYSRKYISLKRRTLDNYARIQNLNPEDYKNKRLLLKAILDEFKHKLHDIELKKETIQESKVELESQDVSTIIKV
jgi:hypothetical protein